MYFYHLPKHVKFCQQFLHSNLCIYLDCQNMGSKNENQVVFCCPHIKWLVPRIWCIVYLKHKASIVQRFVLFSYISMYAHVCVYLLCIHVHVCMSSFYFSVTWWKWPHHSSVGLRAEVKIIHGWFKIPL